MRNKHFTISSTNTTIRVFLGMKKSDLEQIEFKTRDLLEDAVGDIYFIEPPINIAKILEKLGLSLALTGFKDPGVSGAFDKKTQTIYLSKNDSKKRQAFTIAHEIGHIILGHKKKVDLFYRTQADSFDGQSQEEEKQANYFAASLLMPKELVEKFWETHHDIELLAAYFGVSRTAAYWRLKELSLI